MASERRQINWPAEAARTASSKPEEERGRQVDDIELEAKRARRREAEVP